MIYVLLLRCIATRYVEAVRFNAQGHILEQLKVNIIGVTTSIAVNAPAAYSSNHHISLDFYKK